MPVNVKFQRPAHGYIYFLKNHLLGRKHILQYIYVKHQFAIHAIKSRRTQYNNNVLQRTNIRLTQYKNTEY